MNNCKKVVHLKDIESNIIEEAIFVLRSGKSGSHPHESASSAPLYDDFILAEAEFIVNDYMTRRRKYSRASRRTRAVPRARVFILCTLAFSAWLFLLFLLLHFLA